MTRVNQMAFGIGLVLLLAGCGVKGPLYLPTPEPQSEPTLEPTLKPSLEPTLAPSAEITNNNKTD